MRRLSTVLYFALVIAVVIAGCANDEHPSPTAVTGPTLDGPLVAYKLVGPSEIVLCLDVSDAVSETDLTAMIAALQADLADPALIPQDGSISVAALVYGDTAAAALGELTQLTPTSLAETILPALTGLSEDRLVTGAEADLAAALDQALPLLDPGSVPDRHVLVLGTGAVADAAATEASCTALGEAGVMVSAVALGSDDAAAAAFRACADSTGGFFGLGGDDLTAAVANALAYMLQAELDLEPETAELTPGEEHELTATMFRGGDPEAYPLAGMNVDLAVIDGPNAGTMASAATDTDGVAVFRYTGEGGPGTDTVVASSVHPGTGFALTDTVTVIWGNGAPVCDPGGPYVAVVAGDTSRVTLDGSLSSDPDEDELSFLWSVDCDEAAFSDPTAVMPELVITGACLELDSLMVDLMVTDGTDTSSCETVVRLLAANLLLEPETAELMRGEEHGLTATVFLGADPASDPVGDMTIDFAVIEGPNAGAMASAVTDTQGIATWSYLGEGGPGTDTIVASGTYPGTGDALGDTVTVTWLNTAPECDAGGPYAVVVTEDVVEVMLDGSLSSDADEDELSFLWSVDCADAAFDDPTAVMPTLELSGECLCTETLTVELMVTDGFDTTSCEATIAIDDQRPPVIEIRDDPLRLWPPNHHYQTISVEMMITTAEDACGEPLDLDGITVVSVSSDEPEDANGNGDGHTVNDITVSCPNTVGLRAEREGTGNGRVYTIVYRYVDEDGEAMELTGQVFVPHDASDDHAGDDGAAYTVEPDCD